MGPSPCFLGSLKRVVTDPTAGGTGRAHEVLRAGRAALPVAVKPACMGGGWMVKGSGEAAAAARPLGYEEQKGDLPHLGAATPATCGVRACAARVPGRSGPEVLARAPAAPQSAVGSVARPAPPPPRALLSSQASPASCAEGVVAASPSPACSPWRRRGGLRHVADGAKLLAGGAALLLLCLLRQRRRGLACPGSPHITRWLLGLQLSRVHSMLHGGGKQSREDRRNAFPVSRA
ncbi:uncharacterized protein LOC134385853 [Cynocephalus volans]|uniref:uncharacterized protein LOC134385853 n=1 Tax=Cynocephalus volans TaxID=110931 RepID=UPI002FC78525